MKYVYPCIMYLDKSAGYGVWFPDVKGTYTSGLTLYEALCNAEDVLNLAMGSAEEDGDEILPPTPLEDVKLEDGEFVTLIKADTDEYRKQSAQ